MTLNVIDFPPESWNKARQAAINQGLIVFPWGATIADSRTECLKRLDKIVATAVAWNTKYVIIDAEKELDNGFITSDDIALALADFPDAAISTEAWLYFNVDWWPLTEWPVLLQIYPEENRLTPEQIPQFQADCVRHARQRGFLYVGVTFPTYHGSQPTWYNLSGTYSLYTADDCQGDYRQWAPTV